MNATTWPFGTNPISAGHTPSKPDLDRPLYNRPRRALRAAGFLFAHKLVQLTELIWSTPAPELAPGLIQELVSYSSNTPLYLFVCICS